MSISSLFLLGYATTSLLFTTALLATCIISARAAHYPIVASATQPSYRKMFSRFGSYGLRG
jgi:hypothetical protein